MAQEVKYTYFTLKVFENDAVVFWQCYRAEEPVRWVVARDRLVAANLANPEQAGSFSNGWMLSTDPADTDEQKAIPLP